MKRTFLTLFILLTALYAKEGYDFLTSGGTKTSLLSGQLSDIAEEVIAIPLQNSKAYDIRYAKQVRKEGDNLFLICNETIYRFNRKGELLNAVTNPEQMRARGYIIDQRKQQLIVLGNEDDIHYYTFDGKLTASKKLRSDLPGEHVYAMAMHRDSIWTTEERVSYDPDTNKTSIEIQAVKYDISFNKLETKKITSFDTGREQHLSTCYNGEFCIHHDTGDVYLYNPPLSPEYLLSDSLYILNQKKYWLNAHTGNTDITTFPTRMGNRFWQAACDNNQSPLPNYLFCYDTRTNRSWQLAAGFDDDYYQTGSVANLRPLDIYNRNYYFYKSGKELERSFPQSVQEDSLVVFIVKLKA
jgi:hypothetical protein